MPLPRIDDACLKKIEKGRPEDDVIIGVLTMSEVNGETATTTVIQMKKPRVRFKNIVTFCKLLLVFLTNTKKRPIFHYSNPCTSDMFMKNLPLYQRGPKK